MAARYSDEFRRDAVRIATTSGLTRPQIAADLGVGVLTLNKWVQQQQNDDLMSGPHEDLEKENARLRKEARLLREEGDALKNHPGFGPPARGRNRLCYRSATDANPRPGAVTRTETGRRMRHRSQGVAERQTLCLLA
jgi:transposase